MTKHEMEVSRGSWRKVLGCKVHQDHEVTVLNCLAQRALGEIERQMRGVPGAANDIKAGQAGPHGLIDEQENNIRYKNRNEPRQLQVVLRTACSRLAQGTGPI